MASCTLLGRGGNGLNTYGITLLAPHGTYPQQVVFSNGAVIVCNIPNICGDMPSASSVVPAVSHSLVPRPPALPPPPPPLVGGGCGIRSRGKRARASSAEAPGSDVPDVEQVLGTPEDPSLIIPGHERIARKHAPHARGLLALERRGDWGYVLHQAVQDGCLSCVKRIIGALGRKWILIQGA